MFLMSFRMRVGWLIRLVLRLPLFGWEIKVRFRGACNTSSEGASIPAAV